MKILGSNTVKCVSRSLPMYEWTVTSVGGLRQRGTSVGRDTQSGVTRRKRSEVSICADDDGIEISIEVYAGCGCGFESGRVDIRTQQEHTASPHEL
jgi:hypothetical protein